MSISYEFAAALVADCLTQQRTLRDWANRAREELSKPDADKIVAGIGHILGNMEIELLSVLFAAHPILERAER